ncbi:hypothetical protein GCM10027422_37450 [Hymenobacter arcticus]
MKIPFLHRFQKPATQAVTEKQRSEAEATVAALLLALPELLAVAVIDIASGQALAAHTNAPDLVPAKAAPYNAEVVRQKRRALQALDLPGERIEDILITLHQQLHLLRVSHDDQRVLYLAINSRDTNLALVRDVLRAHSG